MKKLMMTVMVLTLMLMMTTVAYGVLPEISEEMVELYSVVIENGAVNKPLITVKDSTNSNNTLEENKDYNVEYHTPVAGDVVGTTKHTVRVSPKEGATTGETVNKTFIFYDEALEAELPVETYRTPNDGPAQYSYYLPNPSEGQQYNSEKSDFYTVAGDIVVQNIIYYNDFGHTLSYFFKDYKLGDQVITTIKTTDENPYYTAIRWTVVDKSHINVEFNAVSMDLNETLNFSELGKHFDTVDPDTGNVETIADPGLTYKLSVSYDDNVVTINPDTGAIKAVGLGNTSIKVETSGTNDYISGTYKIPINVNENYNNADVTKPLKVSIPASERNDIASLVIGKDILLTTELTLTSIAAIDISVDLLLAEEVVGSIEVDNEESLIVTLEPDLLGILERGRNYIVTLYSEATGTGHTIGDYGYHVFNLYIPSIPSTSNSSSSDFYTTQTDLWNTVKERIQDASSGDNLTVDVEYYTNMPSSVMELLSTHNVGLTIQWDGGADIEIPVGTAQAKQSGRVHWTLDTLAELYSEITTTTPTEPTAPTVTDDDKYNPGTGAKL